MMRWIYSVALTVAGLVGMSAPASAQYTPLMNPLTRTTIPQVIQCPECNRARQNPTPRPQTTAPPRIVEAPPTVNPAVLRFTPNLAARQRNFAALVTNAEQQNLGSGAALQALFDGVDVIAAMDGVMAPLGLRNDNLGDVFAFYVISNRMAVNQRYTPLTREQAQGVKAQVSRGLLAQSGAPAASNDQKQQAAEELIVQSLLVTAVMQGTRGDRSAMADVSVRAARNVQGMGLDLDTLELGPDGFQLAD